MKHLLHTLWICFLLLASSTVAQTTLISSTVNNGGLHGTLEKFGSIALTAGTYYPIRIQFGEIGGGDVIETLEDMVWRHSLSEKVFFKGKMPIEELVKYTSVADLGVSLDKDTNLNYRYSLPNKLFDYIQCGIPVFSSNLVELKNVIEKYKVGYIASNHEPNYLAKRLTEIFEDEVTLAQYKANARKAAEELCWEKEKIKFEQIVANAF